jgi:scyllo-inositol 2-dehydrogenase (NAD+)
MIKLGVGVLGVGTMGMQHARNLRGLIPEAKLVAVADADIQRAETAARELELERFLGSAEALVSLPDVQAVVIATPAKFHGAAVRVSAQAGKDIFCEKPFTLTVSEADALIEITGKAGVRIQVGHMRRYDPPNIRAKQRIEAGEIGDPAIFKSLARDPAPPPISYMASGVNGTFFQDSAIHEFDLGRWIMGDEIDEIHAYGAILAVPELAQFGDVDTALVNMRFSRGALGAVENYMHSGYGYDVRTEIVGTKGSIFMGQVYESSEIVLTEQGARTRVVDNFLTRFRDAYLLEMADFVHRILADQAPAVDAMDGRQAVAAAEAAERSYRDKRPVAVENRKR